MNARTSLPTLDANYPVGASQQQEYAENGHILLPGILSGNEISDYRTAINNAAYRFNTEKRKIEERDTYGKAFLQIMNLWEMDEAVREFTLAKRFARIAASLMGVENVRLYHDQALYKEPGGGPTPWHQDLLAARHCKYNHHVDAAGGHYRGHGDAHVCAWLARGGFRGKLVYFRRVGGCLGQVGERPRLCRDPRHRPAMRLSTRAGRCTARRATHRQPCAK